ncbi:MAG: hypothetical protein WBO55_15780, partial [Rhizobiaceae bacterium]
MSERECLFEGVEIKRHLPENATQPQLDHFCGLLEFRSPAVWLRHHDRLVVSARGEPYDADGLLDIHFPLPEREQLRDADKYARRGEEAARNAVMLPGTHAWITDRFSANYYHWLADALPRLELLVQHARGKVIQLLLPPKVAAQSFVRDSLAAHASVQVTSWPDGAQAVRPEQLAIPDHVSRNGHPVP